MDTAAFIVALLVFAVIGFWYVENEMKNSDAAHGLFAVRAGEMPRRRRLPRYAESPEAQRYRRRETSPAASARPEDGLRAAAAPKYRRKERAWDRAAKLDEEN